MSSTETPAGPDDVVLASSRPARGRWIDGCLAAALAAFGVVLCLHYGRRGFMPLDQSIVWDAGWRLLLGQVPFRDFVTTTSVAPGALQAAFFAVGGVSWLTYCAHAALANGVFAAGAFALLRAEGLPPVLAAAFGGASAVFFYPPFGVPYGDQHSFFFALLALLVAATARRRVSSRAPARWAMVPALLLLGYLSKPVPVGFLVPAVAVFALWPGKDRWLSRMAVLASGAALSLAALAALLAAGGADLTLAWEYLVRLPLESGGRRALGQGWLADRLLGLLRVGSRSGLAFPAAAVLASVVAAGGLLPLRSAGAQAREVLRPLVAAWLLWGGTVLFVGVTKNEARNGHALLPVVLGLLAAAVAGVFRLARERSSSPRWGASARWAAAAAPAALALVVVHDAVRFDATVNATRLVHGGGYDPRRAEAARSELPDALGFVQWGLPRGRYSPGDLRTLVAAVAAEPRPVLLVSDSLVVYGLAGKPSVNPNLWYHPGVSMPRIDDVTRTQRLEALFVARLEQEQPGLVVFDPPPGPGLFQITMLPRVDSWLRARQCGVGRIGPFPVWRLCGKGGAALGPAS
jgi:hypothetical protein